jgi:hypothetical protein
MRQFLTDPVLEAVQKLKPIADRAGCSLAQLAIAWVIAQPGITSAIVGASRPEQLRETAGGRPYDRPRAARRSGNYPRRSAPVVSHSVSMPRGSTAFPHFSPPNMSTPAACRMPRRSCRGAARSRICRASAKRGRARR